MNNNSLRMIEQFEHGTDALLVEALKNLVARGEVQVRPELVVDESTGETLVQLRYSIPSSDEAPSPGYSELE